MVERARTDEALQDGRSARFVVSDGSPLVDLLAWGEADFYEGSFDEKGLQQLLLYLSGKGASRSPSGRGSSGRRPKSGCSTSSGSRSLPLRTCSS
jgi:hypothetical protein